jgi:hypothetical protein
MYVCLQVANLACSMSSNEEGVKMVRLAASEIEKLCPQVCSLLLLKLTVCSVRESCLIKFHDNVFPALRYNPLSEVMLIYHSHLSFDEGSESYKNTNVP